MLLQRGFVATLWAILGSLIVVAPAAHGATVTSLSAPREATTTAHQYDDAPNFVPATIGDDGRAGAAERSVVDASGASLALSAGFVAPRGTPPLFSQTTASSTFRHGSFAGQSIGDVAGAIRAGKISPAELPIDVIVRNGETLGLNTRSMLALRRAGVDPSRWVINDVTGVSSMERLLTERLLRNDLSGGIDVLRITGAGPNASNLR